MAVSRGGAQQSCLPRQGPFICADRQARQQARCNAGGVSAVAVALFRLFDRNQLALCFVPEMQADRAEAVADGQALHFCQFGMVANDLGQAVERDAAVEVMHMMDADIA